MINLFIKLNRKEIMKGYLALEAILAAVIFIIFATGVAGSVIQGISLNRLSSEQTIATQYASEGIDAVRSIRNQGFSRLQSVNSNPRGVALVGNVWTFTGDNTNNTIQHTTTDNYIRTITVASVNRSATPPNGNIVASGGSVDNNTKKVTSTVRWNFTSFRPQQVTLVTYITAWNEILP